jgi:phosphoribosylaminoimidazole-succinocarboxamide synthase
MWLNIPQVVTATPLHKFITGSGLKRIYQTATRDTYSLPDKSLQLDVYTDRVSVFDFVLPALVPDKGEVLVALVIFWLEEVLANIPNNLVAYGVGIDQHLPSSLRKEPTLQKCALVTQHKSSIPVGFIVRGYLTGFATRAYEKQNQHVCGFKFPPGLRNGSRLNIPCLTPSTLVEGGEGQPFDIDLVIQWFGMTPWYRSLEVYDLVSEVASNAGFILADIKLTFGIDHCLTGEVGTPDTCSFWNAKEWEQAYQAQKIPPLFEKELLLEWGREEVHINQRDPSDRADQNYVHELVIPPIILDQTSRLYRQILTRLTQVTLSEFQSIKLGVS